MMKKFLMLIVALVACISINAQTALQTTKVLDNTYIGINFICLKEEINPNG